MGSEDFKGGVHGLMGGLAAAFALYNLMAYGERRETRNAINAGIYFGLWLLEGVQARHHWSKK
jgi:hypothetical protein